MYMDDFEKRKCLFIFKQLLAFYNKRFIIPEPVFYNAQPSASIENQIVKAMFFDEMLDLVPHAKTGTACGFSYVDRLVASLVIGRYWPKSTYKFINEMDYISTMKTEGFTVEPARLSPKQTFDALFDNYIGYGLVTKTKNHYVVDARYLKQFEIRDGYSKLDVIVYLDNALQFDYCKINGKIRADDLAIRECITVAYAIAAIERHLICVHLLVSDQINMVLASLDRSNPIYRILTPITNDPYLASEAASVGLFGQTGICNWSNFTRAGVCQYYEHVKRDFKIRDFLIPKKMPGKSAVHKHQHLWFNCIRKFVSEFMSAQKSFDCDEFIESLKCTYNGICDERKTKLENVTDICAMMIYSNIVHECSSNPKFSKLSNNPFVLSTSWKQNESLKLADKINLLGEQTEVSFVFYATSMEAIRMNDERWVDMCCINEEEKRIYKRFLKSMTELDIPKDAILHPNNVSSSVAY
jgi:hypothetical protein